MTMSRCFTLFLTELLDNPMVAIAHALLGESNKVKNLNNV